MAWSDSEVGIRTPPHCSATSNFNPHRACQQPFTIPQPRRYLSVGLVYHRGRDILEVNFEDDLQNYETQFADTNLQISICSERLSNNDAAAFGQDDECVMDKSSRNQENGIVLKGPRGRDTRQE